MNIAKLMMVAFLLAGCATLNPEGFERDQRAKLAKMDDFSVCWKKWEYQEKWRYLAVEEIESRGKTCPDIEILSAMIHQSANNAAGLMLLNQALYPYNRFSPAVRCTSTDLGLGIVNTTCR